LAGRATVRTLERGSLSLSLSLCQVDVTVIYSYFRILDMRHETRRDKATCTTNHLIYCSSSAPTTNQRMLRIRHWYCCWSPRANTRVYLAVSQQATSSVALSSHNYKHIVNYCPTLALAPFLLQRRIGDDRRTVTFSVRNRVSQPWGALHNDWPTLLLAGACAVMLST